MNSIDYLVKSAIIKVPHTKGMGEEIVVNSPARIFSRIFSSTVDTVVDADVANARIRLIDEITTIASQSIIP